MTVVVVAVVVVAAMPTASAQRAARTTARAPLPTFSDGQLGGVFFDDVPGEALVGARPANLGQTAIASAGPAMAPGAAMAAAGPEASASGWDGLISAATIEDEIKKINLRLNEAITTPTAFAGNGYRITRQEFSMLAGLFGVIAEYGGDVRFKDKAPGARDHFARAAAGSKVGTQQAYDQARRVREDLQGLVSGSSVEFQTPTADLDWALVIDRAPIMVRLDDALNNKLRAATSNEAAFKDDPEAIEHEAELVAALSAMLAHEQMPDSDSDDYADWCQQMKAAARQIVDGVKLNNYEQVRTGVSELGKQCDDCHGVYR